MLLMSGTLPVRKRKISVSLDESTIIQLMGRIANSDFKSRSQAIEYAAERMLSTAYSGKVKQSIALHPLILERINTLVACGQFRSVSHFIEHAINEFMRGDGTA